ncbi:MAG: tetratricopeptide repeat protein [Planctomycetota bacterium]
MIAQFLMLALCLTLSALTQKSPFEEALENARTALAAGNLDAARHAIDRAIERDPKSREVWELRARWTEASGDRDELIYSLHVVRRLALAQRATKAEQQALRARLEQVDPIAPDLLDLKQIFVEKLLPIATAYEKDRRPHSAIRVHQEILALDPEHSESDQAIERLSAAPDPSLAETAKPKDLLAGVSEEWVAQHDRQHNTWKTRSRLERPSYITFTDAGYEVMLLAGEAMEQMNAFYRTFFQYGTPGD